MDQTKAGPPNHWRVGKYRIGRYRAWQWEVSDGMLGSSGPTPLHALIRQMKWKRAYRNAPPGTWAR